MAYKLFSQEYTTPGTYTFNVPIDCYFVIITASGAGGGGGRSTNPGAGGGGGAGQMVEGLHYKVTPLGTLSITVGSGGVGTTAIGTAALLPSHATPGGTVVGGNAEQIRAGGGGDGDGGTYTIIGTIRLLSGAGGITDSHGGSGGGAVAYLDASGPIGNMGDQLSGIGAGASPLRPHRKDSGRWFSGAGGGSGSHTIPGNPGGNGGSAAFNLALAGGSSGGGANGSGAGGSSLFGPGGVGVTSTTVGTAAPATSYGAGAAGGANNGAAGFISGGKGADGYVLLSWWGIVL